jgi:hypothetical protein
VTAPSPLTLNLARTPIRDTLDRRFWLAALVGSVGSFVLFGLVSAIIPNPVFGREIPPDGPSYAIWLLSAPLMGLVFAAMVTPPPGATAAAPTPSGERDLGSGGLTLGGIAAFFAIGCPLCNKIALLALGSTGALTFFAPIQPFIGVASLVILAWTVRWTLRRRADGCPVRAG